MSKELSVYVHIPFCSSRCDYCAFFSSTFGKDVQRKYISALKKEASLYSKLCKDYTVVTAYIGGGTPSCLYDGAISEISEILKSSFNTELVEFTAEANPSSFSLEKAEEYFNAGINRVSLGVQSLNQKTLDAINRKQEAEAVIPLIKELVSKFSSVSADLIIGLPYTSKDGVLEDAKRLIDSKVTHISAYALSVEDGTELEKKVKDGRVVLPDEDEQAETYSNLYEFLKQNGFERYEVSNFCKDGKYSRHNMAYWTGSEYLGLGSGAHGYFNGYRYNNIYSINEYIARMEDCRSVRENEKYIDEKERETERIMLGLRTKNGIVATENVLKKIGKSNYKDCFEIDEGRVKIKEEYFYVMNTLICELI